MDVEKFGLAKISRPYEVGITVYEIGGKTVGFATFVINTLGTKDSDGFPYLIKLIAATANIFEGFQYASSPFAKSVINMNSTLKPGLDLLSCLAAPFCDFHETVNEVKKALKALQGRVEDKKKVEIQFVQQDGTPLPDEYKEKYPTFRVERVVVTESKARASMAIVQAFANISIYSSCVCEALVKLAEFQAVHLTDSTLNKLSRVGGTCFSVFAFIGAGGSIINTVTSIVDYSKVEKNSEEAKVKYAVAETACANFAKVAIKMALLFFSISPIGKGVAQLSVFCLEIFILNRTSGTVLWEQEKCRLNMKICAADSSEIPSSEMFN